MIEIHDIHNEPVTILNPDGTELVTTDNVLVFDDVRLQIKEQKLQGYKIRFRGKICEIKSTGRIFPWPNGLMDKHLEILRELI